MTNILIILLAFLHIFAKYGEPTAKFMSIRGDINLAMFPTIEKGETVGFVYENEYGGFSLDTDHCQSRHMGKKIFLKQADCTVQSNRSSSAYRKHNNYIAKHDPNFPVERTGTNLIVGKYDIHIKTTVYENNQITYIANVPPKDEHKRTLILCNDKSPAHYRALFEFSSSPLGFITFLKGDRDKYEQTMKCIAMVFNKTNYVVAASVFSMTIRYLDPETSLYLSSIPISQYAVEFINETSNAILDDTQIQTNFVFRTDDSNGCKPDLIIEMVKTKQRILKFTYGNITGAMPSIYADESHVCGVTRDAQMDSLFVYSCTCK